MVFAEIGQAEVRRKQVMTGPNGVDLEVSVDSLGSQGREGREEWCQCVRATRC